MFFLWCGFVEPLPLVWGNKLHDVLHLDEAHAIAFRYVDVSSVYQTDTVAEEEVYFHILLNARNCIVFLTVFVCLCILFVYSLYSFRDCEPLYLLGLKASKATKSIVLATKSIVLATKSIVWATKSIVLATKSIELMVKS